MMSVWVLCFVMISPRQLASIFNTQDDVVHGCIEAGRGI